VNRKDTKDAQGTQKENKLKKTQNKYRLTLSVLRGMNWQSLRLKTKKVNRKDTKNTQWAQKENK